MPRGKFETFKLELKLDRDQRRKWGAMDEAALKIVELARMKLTGFQKSGIPIVKHAFIESAKKESISNDFLPITVDGILDKVYDSANPGLQNRKGGNFPFNLPREEVLFSTTERVVRLPYLGVTKYFSNQRMDLMPAVSSSGYSPWSKVQRISMCVLNNLHILLIDCRSLETVV